MSGTVRVHVHDGYREAHSLLAAHALAADPPAPGGRTATAGELVLPADIFWPERLAQMLPFAVWEAWWDGGDGSGRYAANHPRLGPLEGRHHSGWIEHPLSRGWAWDDDSAQVAEVRAAFADAAALARARARVAADDQGRYYPHIADLAADRRLAGAVAVLQGPWVLTWSGDEDYTLETLGGDGRPLSVLDQVSYAVEPPARWMLHPWAAARGWVPPATTANPRLADWMRAAGWSNTPVGVEPDPVPLAAAASVGLVRPRHAAERPAADAALFDLWQRAVARELPGCTLHRYTAGPQSAAGDPDGAVLVGPVGTDMHRVRAAGAAAAAALGWTGPAPQPPARQLPPSAVAAVAELARAAAELRSAQDAAAGAWAGYDAILAELSTGPAPGARRPREAATLERIAGAADAVRGAAARWEQARRSALGQGLTAEQAAQFGAVPGGAAEADADPLLADAEADADDSAGRSR